MKTNISKVLIAISVLLSVITGFSTGSIAAEFSDISKQETREDIAVSIPFTLTTSGEKSITFTSSDQNLIPDEYLIYESEGNYYTMVATPYFNATGTATITITVNDNDGLTWNSFEIKVTDTDDSLSYWNDNQDADVVIKGGKDDNPYGIAVDPTTGKIFVSDSSKHCIFRYASAEAAYSEAVFGSINTPGSADNEMNYPTGIHVDTFGNLWVADMENNRILRFNDASSKSPGGSADAVLGQAGFGSSSRGTSQNTMSSPTDVWVDPTGSLWVADSQNHRILRFDNAVAKGNGANADALIGQPRFDSNNSGTAENQMNTPMSIIGYNHNHLFVSELFNNRVICFKNVSSKNYTANADIVLGQPNFGSNTPNTSKKEMNYPVSLAMDVYGRLYVAEMNNNRILIFNDAINKPQKDGSADFVIGQKDFDSKDVGSTDNGLNNPSSINFDLSSNYLWVADSKNNRILSFSSNTKNYPTLGKINNQTIPESTSEPITFTATDINSQSLTITYSYSNPDLLTSNSFTFSGDKVALNASTYTVNATSTSTTITLNLAPITKKSGTSSITITVTDPDGLSATNSFTLIVENNAPTITNITAQTIKEDAVSENISFTITDTEGDSMTITIDSSNKDLFPSNTNNITLSNASGGSSQTLFTESDSDLLTLKLKPEPEKSGTSTITITVSDGKQETTKVFTVEVLSENDPPTISEISDQTIDEDKSLTLTFSVADIDSSSLTISVKSNNYTLIQSNSSGITLLTKDNNNLTKVSNSTYILTTTDQNEPLTLPLQLTPVANQYGETFITISVTDNAYTNTESFTLNVSSVNDSPTITSISSQTTNEDTPITGIKFTVDDNDNDTLTISVQSSDTSLFPSQNIIYTLETAPGEVTLALTPATNQSGPANITILVEDANTQVSTSFSLSVTPVVDNPQISTIEDQTINEDSETSPITFTVSNPDATTLTINIESGNTDIVPSEVQHIKLKNSSNIEGNPLQTSAENETFTLTVAPASNQTGSVVMTVSINNDTETESFTITINPVNDAPGISKIENQSTPENKASEQIAITLVDADNDQLTITIESSKTDLINPVSKNITLTKASGESITPWVADPGSINLVLMPQPEQSGKATITVSVSDGKDISYTSFEMTVNEKNDAPYILAISDQSIIEDKAFDPINLTAIDADGDSLTIKVLSSDKELFPSNEDHIKLQNAIGITSYSMVNSEPDNLTLYLIPESDKSGTATITLIVTDSKGLSSSTSFSAAVTEVNDKPAIDGLSGNYSTNEDNEISNITFQVSDVDTNSLIVSVESGDKNLVPSDSNHISLCNAGGCIGASLTTASGTDSLTLKILSDLNQSGTVDITVTVSDSLTQTSKSFELTITPVNDPPEITEIINNQPFQEDTDFTIQFKTSDIEDKEACSLTITMNSSDQTIISNNQLTCICNENQYTINATPEADKNGSLSIDIIVTDSGGLAKTESFNLTITPVNDKPVINANKEIFTTKKNISISITGISIEDIDAAENYVSLTLVAGPFGSLTFNGVNNNTLSITSTITQINSWLADLEFEPTEATGKHYISITVNDLGHTGGTHQSDTKTITINITDNNIAPVNTVPPSLTMTEDESLFITSISVEDSDAADNPIKVTLTAQNGCLSLSATDGLTTTNYKASEMIVLTGTQSDIRKALENLTLTSTTNNNDPITVTLITDDLGHSGGDNKPWTDTDSIVITVTPVNDLPVNTLQETLTINEDESGSFTASVEDFDGNMEIINVILEAGTGKLKLNTTKELTGDFAEAGFLSFTGAIVHVNVALSNITYTPAVNMSENDSITMASYDSDRDASPNSKVMTVSINPINDEPTITCDPCAYSIDEDNILPILMSDPVSDIDAGSNDIKVYIQTANGSIKITETSGVTIENGKSITLTGSIPDINTTLKKFDFIPSENYFGNDAAIEIIVDDQGNSPSTPMQDKITINISVKPVNDAPYFNNIPEEQQATIINVPFNIKGISVNDIDVNSNPIQLTLTAEKGVISINNDGLTLESGNYSESSLSVSGTIIAINNALNDITYEPGTTGVDTLKLYINDLGHTGTGNKLTDDALINITISNINQPPVITGKPDHETVNEDQPITQTIVITDEDASDESIQFTLVTMNGSIELATTSELSEVKLPNKIISYKGSVADINDSLNKLVFKPESEFSGIAGYTLFVNDLGFSGSGGAKSSEPAIITITYLPINDKPVITIENSMSVNEDEELSLTISVSDNDAYTHSIQVELTAQHGIMTLKSIDGLTFITNDGIADTSMSFTGIIDSINTAMNSMTFSPTANFHGNAEIEITTSDLGNSIPAGLANAESVTDKISINVDNVNDKPVITSTAILTALEGDAYTYVIQVDDPDEDDTIKFTPSCPDFLTLTKTGERTAILSGTPGTEDVGIKAITITVTDSHETVNQSFSLSISKKLNKPEITDVPEDINVDDSANIPFKVTDTDSEELVVTVISSDSKIVSYTCITINGKEGSKYTITSALVSNDLTLHIEPMAEGEVTITIVVADGSSLVDKKAFNMNVKFLNEAPEFSKEKFIFPLPEDSAVDYSVGTLTATDADMNKLAYTITSGNVDKIFAIDESTGTITLIGEDILDYETNKRYELSVSVSDGISSVSASVTINLTDVDESPIIGIIEDLIIREDSNAIIQFKVTDEDSDALTITVTSNDQIVDETCITINDISGTTNSIPSGLTSNDVELKIVPKNDGKVTLTVTVSDSTELSDSKSFTMTVVFVNKKPEFTNTPLDLKLKENSEENHEIETLKAVDPDGHTLTYKILSGDENNAFKINNSGLIQVNDSNLLNFEDTPTYNLIVEVTDGHSPVTASVSINLIDQNDPPVINPIENQGTKEDTVKNIPFNVSDEDSKDVLTITVESSNSQVVDETRITINETGSSTYTVVAGEESHNLTLNIEPLKEGKTKITITVSDGILNNRTEFQLDVSNVNKSPTLSDTTFNNLKENITVGDPVGTLEANDPDNNPLTYTITNGNNKNAFTIETNDDKGVIKVSGALDYESQNKYELTVMVTDSFDSSTTATIFINLTNVNEEPEISLISDQIINEDPETSLRIPFYVTDVDSNNLTITVRNSDPSIVNNDSISINGTTGATYSITKDSETYSLTLNLNPSENANGSLSFIVSATDSEFTATTEFNLTVTSVNDPPTIVGKTITKPENMENGDSVGKIDVSDIDSEDLIVSITNGNVDSAFIIDNNGNITVNNSSALNYENYTSYALTVAVSDSKLTATAQVIINIEDENESPEISSIINQKINEDTTLSIPFNVADVDSNNLTISVSSSNTSVINNDSISINDKPGDTYQINKNLESYPLTLLLKPVQNEKGSLKITITVNDGEFTDQIDFTLEITSVNDAPKINESDKSFKFGVNENINPGEVGNLTASDVDGDLLTWSITEGNINSVFKINNGKIEIIDKINYEDHSSYTLTVEVSDGSLTDVAQGVIAVTNVNEPPEISIVDEADTDEDKSISIPFNVTDVDGNALTIKVSSNKPSLVNDDSITINSVPGTTYSINEGLVPLSLTLVINPVADEHGEVKLSISVTDNVNLTNTTELQLTVKQVNDEPTITGPFTYTINENSNINTTVVKMSASDIDDQEDKLKWEIIDNDSPFKITYGGIIKVNKEELNFENITTYTLTLEVVDLEGASDSDTITINVKDINEEPTISKIDNKTVDEYTTTDPISFTVHDVDDGDALTIKILSSDESVIAINADNITICSQDCEKGGTMTLGESADSQNIGLYILPAKDGVAQITITVEDKEETVSESFTLTVNNVNKKPEIAVSNASVTMNEDESKTIQFSVFDEDCEGRNVTLTVSTDNEALIPINSDNISIESSGLNYTLNATTETPIALRITPLSNQFGTCDITIAATDADGDTVTKTFSLEVKMLKDDSPILSDIAGSPSIEEDNIFETNLSVMDYDGGKLKIELKSSKPEIVPIENISVFSDNTQITELTTNSHSTKTLKLKITPIDNANGKVTISIIATDDQGLTGTRSFELVIQAVNDNPVIEPIKTLYIDEDSKNYEVELTVSDVDGGILTLEASSNDQNLIANSDLVFSSEKVNTTAGVKSIVTLLVSTQAEKYGSAGINIKVKDDSLEDIESFKINVNSVNDPPVLETPIKDQNPGEAEEDNNYSFTLANDTFEDVDSELTYSASLENGNLLPAWLFFDKSNKKFSGTPANGDDGTYTITVAARDQEYTATDELILTVKAVNDPPTLAINSSTITFTTKEEELTTINFSFNDIDDNMLTITVETDHDYFNIIEICDGETCKFPPYQFNPKQISLKKSLAVLQILTDINMESITGILDLNSKIGLPESIYYLKSNTLSLKVTPKKNESGPGPYQVTLIVTDPDGLTATQQINIEIIPVPDPPTLNVYDTFGDEDMPIKIEIEVEPGDVSEKLSAKIEGIPTGATVKFCPKNVTECTLEDNILTKRLNLLTITPPENSSKDIPLTVTLFSTESNGDDVETDPQQLTITVNSVPDIPEKVEMKSAELSVKENETVSVLFNKVEFDDDDGSEQWAKIVVENCPQNAIYSIGSLEDNTLTINSSEILYTNTKIENWGFTITPSGPNDASYTMTIKVYSNDEDDRAVLSKASEVATVHLNITSQEIKTDVSGNCFISISSQPSNTQQLPKIIGLLLFVAILAFFKQFSKFHVKNILTFILATMFIFGTINVTHAEEKPWQNIDWEKYKLFKFKDFEYFSFKPMITMESMGTGQTDEVFVLNTQTSYSSPLGLQFSLLSKKKKKYFFELSLDYISSFSDDAGGKSNSINVINLMGSWKWPYAVSDRVNAFGMFGFGFMITQQDISFRSKSVNLRNWGLSTRFGVGFDWKLDDRWSLGMELTSCMGIGNVDFAKYNSLNLVATYRFGNIQPSSPDKPQPPDLTEVEKIEAQIVELHNMISQIEQNEGSRYDPFKCEQLSENYKDAKNALKNKQFDEAKRLIRIAKFDVDEINIRMKKEVNSKIKKLNSLIGQLDSNSDYNNVTTKIYQAKQLATELKIKDAFSKLNQAEENIHYLLESTCKIASNKINETKEFIDSLPALQADVNNMINRAKEKLNDARVAYHNKLCKDAIEKAKQAKNFAQSVANQLGESDLKKAAESRLKLAEKNTNEARKLANNLERNYQVSTPDTCKLIQNYYNSALNAYNNHSYNETIKYANLATQAAETFNTDIQSLAQRVYNKKLRVLERKSVNLSKLIDKMTFLVSPVEVTVQNSLLEKATNSLNSLKNQRYLKLLERFKKLRSVQKRLNRVEHDINKIPLQKVHARIVLEAAGNDPKAIDYITAKEGVVKYLLQLKKYRINKRSIDVQTGQGYQDQVQFMDSIDEIKKSFPMFQADSSFRSQFKKAANSFSYDKGIRKFVYVISSQRTFIVPDDLKKQTDYLRKRNISFSCIYIYSDEKPGESSLKKMAKKTKGKFRACKTPEDIRNALKEIFQQ
ncbi:secreted protein containing Dystroglycan-type cadherin-like protein [Candidatus Magnetomorum sp. HK-1]|nr:secreted protein containing Dystroglycan-type cadherin-like protein [Candidatus Magnetomorum sp. HK-1]